MKTDSDMILSEYFPIDSLSASEKEARFEKAVHKIVTPKERQRHGIGMQKEKTLHAVLKNYEEPDEDHQEIPIGNYIADIYGPYGIVEIQTANFDKMREKLSAFLPEYRVRIVYPIPSQKWITWIDPDTGELKKRNKSPRKGTFYHAFRELYRIRPYLADPNLSIELLLIDMEEYRLQDGWSTDRKRGSHRYDRIPLKISDEMLLTQPRDYLQLVPYDLEEPFTAAQFAKKVGFKKKGFSTVLQILTEMGVTERVGKKGNAYLYRVPETLD